MKFLLTILLAFVFLSCKPSAKTDEKLPVPEKNKEVVQDPNTIHLEVYDYQGLKPFLNREDDKIYVVNFWATWCAPCIKELPYFEELQANYAGQNVDVLLVSLDFPRQYDTKLKPFLAKHQLKSKVVCLDDVDQNKWIPAIDSSWTGAIPATIIYNKEQRKFYETSFIYKELETELLKFLN